MFRNCTQASGVLQDLLLTVNLIKDKKKITKLWTSYLQMDFSLSFSSLKLMELKI